MRFFAFLIAIGLSISLPARAETDPVTEYVDALNARAPLKLGTLFELTRMDKGANTLVAHISIIGNKSEDLAADYWDSVEIMAVETTLCANDAQSSAYAMGYNLRFIYTDSAGKQAFQRDVPREACRGVTSAADIEPPSPEENLHAFVARVRGMPSEALDAKGDVYNDGAWVTAQEIGFQLRFAKKSAAQVPKAWFDSRVALGLAVMHCKGGPEIEYAYSTGRAVLLHYVDKSGKTVKDVRINQARCEALDKTPITPRK